MVATDWSNVFVMSVSQEKIWKKFVREMTQDFASLALREVVLKQGAPEAFRFRALYVLLASPESKLPFYWEAKRRRFYKVEFPVGTQQYMTDRMIVFAMDALGSAQRDAWKMTHRRNKVFTLTRTNEYIRWILGSVSQKLLDVKPNFYQSYTFCMPVPDGSLWEFQKLLDDYKIAEGYKKRVDNLVRLFITSEDKQEIQNKLFDDYAIVVRDAIRGFDSESGVLTYSSEFLVDQLRFLLTNERFRNLYLQSRYIISIQDASKLLLQVFQLDLELFWDFARLTVESKNWPKETTGFWLAHANISRLILQAPGIANDEMKALLEGQLKEHQRESVDPKVLEIQAIIDQMQE